jgi:hypothetical protein
LHNFGIAYTKIAPNKLSAQALAGTKVLIVDCAGELNAEELKAVGTFVRNGGYLITTDCALDGCLSRAVPGYIMWNGGYSPGELVDAHIFGGDPELLKGTVPHAYWKLDPKCQTVRILNHSAVTVLVASRQLIRDDPDNKGILACTFNHGKGRVLHLVGHFDNNNGRAFTNMLPDPAPAIGISLRQAIAANFIAEGLKAGQQKSESSE